ncbi:hypothetical protein FRC07_007230 [Ceratobasidium sp. 392]|nr:hypothetical protein FRC07_007230 [Ceratobasidium sp. 392]
MNVKERPAVMILNLITRYWPYAIKDKNQILNFMLDWGYSHMGDSAETKILSKDESDMSILVETYISLMTKPSTSSKFFIIDDAVRFVKLLKGGPIVMILQLVGKLIVSVLNQVWMELTAPSWKAKDTESAIQLCGAVLTLMIPLRKASQDLILTLLTALLPHLSNEHGIDYINLMGRLAVLGLHSVLRSADLMPLQSFLFKNNMLLDSLDEVLAPMVKTFSHGRHD